MPLWGFLLGLSAPGYGLWPLAWLALIPALARINRQDSYRSVFWDGFWLGAVYHALYCLWFLDLHPLTWLGFDLLGSRLVTLAGWLLITVEGGLLMGLLMLAFKALKTPWAQLLLFPLVWVFGFATFNWTPMALPWAWLEYTQAGLWPMRWLAGVLSAGGVAALLVFHNTLWAVWWPRWPQPVRVSAFPLIVPALLALLNGLNPPALPSGLPVPVAVVQANLPIEVIRSTALNPAVIGPAYIHPVEAARLPAGTLLVYPEEGVAPGWVPLEAPGENPFFRRLQALAAQKRIYIAVGVSTRDWQGRRYNSIALIAPDSARLQFYHKRRLVPFGEFTPYGLGHSLSSFLASLNIHYSAPFQAGQRGELLRVNGIVAGALICFELIDTDPFWGGYARQYQQQGAQLLINASNLGWFHQNPWLEAQFLAIGRMRAAETGLPLVIASNTGISAILSPRGAILQKTDPGTGSRPKTQILFYNK